MTVEGYFANMNRLCKKLGYDAGKVSTMGTGVPMKNIAIKQAAYEGIRVTAVVTAGAEGNPGRVGDKAVYNAIAKEKIAKCIKQRYLNHPRDNYSKFKCRAKNIVHYVCPPFK